MLRQAESPFAVFPTKASKIPGQVGPTLSRLVGDKPVDVRLHRLAVSQTHEHRIDRMGHEHVSTSDIAQKVV
jgi:hypothetical protein